MATACVLQFGVLISLLLYSLCNKTKQSYNGVIIITQNSFSEYINKYATEDVLREQGGDSSSEDGETSDLSEDEAQDMEL